MCSLGKSDGKCVCKIAALQLNEARRNDTLLAVEEDIAQLALLRWLERTPDQLFESEALSADLRDEIRTEAEVAKAVVQEAREHRQLMALEYGEAVERLQGELSASGNYVADDSTFARVVQFRNGRVVQVKMTDGRVHLGVGWKEVDDGGRATVCPKCKTNWCDCE